MKDQLIKWKVYASFLKERDWLEYMASNGWILDKIDFGMRYHFNKTAPANKVFEIDNFSISLTGNARKQVITSRNSAFDIINQAGWEIVTHDEAMNYYFIKDRNDDESDEFYADEESRRIRADKFHKRYSFELPHMLLSLLVVVTVLYVALFYMLRNETKALIVFMGIYIGLAILEVTISLMTMKVGERIYQEFLLSREQWENRKKHSHNASFHKTDKLLAFLQEMDSKGLYLIECDKKTYLFEEGNEKYTYYADTKKALIKRMKKAGKKVSEEKKDWERQSLWWYETSIQDAGNHGLELVCAVEHGTLIYRKKTVDGPSNWQTGAITTGSHDWITRTKPVIAAAFIIGLIAGFFIFPHIV